MTKNNNALSAFFAAAVAVVAVLFPATSVDAYPTGVGSCAAGFAKFPAGTEHNWQGNMNDYYGDVEFSKLVVTLGDTPLQRPAGSDQFHYTGDCTSGYLCGLCQGNCAADTDCDAGLQCFVREADEPVPGCGGTAGLFPGTSYCYDPSLDTARRMQESSDLPTYDTDTPHRLTLSVPSDGSSSRLFKGFMFRLAGEDDEGQVLGGSIRMVTDDNDGIAAAPMQVLESTGAADGTLTIMAKCDAAVAAACHVDAEEKTTAVADIVVPASEASAGGTASLEVIALLGEHEWYMTTYRLRFVAPPGAAGTTEEVMDDDNDDDDEAKVVEDDPTQPPANDDTSLASSTPTDPTPSPTAAATPVVDVAQGEEIASDNNNNSCTEYQSIVRIDDKLVMYYVVDGNKETISIKLELDGEAWIGLGVSPDGSGKMIGGETVIALPGEPVGTSNPGEYYMTAQVNAGVFLMEDEKQTITDGNIMQQDGKTVVTFTKKLVEDGKAPILANDDENVFLWAYGHANELLLHKATGAFRLALSYCVAGSSEPRGIPSEVSAQSLGSYSADKRRKMWNAHAILGLLAWAFLVPLAVSASWLRKLFPQRWRPTVWFKIHMYTNIISFVMTIAAFALAVTMYADENEKHFEGPHEAMGLAILIVMTLQSACGILRPSAVAKSSSQQKTAVSSSMPEVDKTNVISIETGVAGEVQGLPEKDNDPDKTFETSRGSSDSQNLEDEEDVPKVSMSRAAWEAAHKYVGFVLLFIGLWQVQTGIELYAAKFGTRDYTSGFGWYIGAFATLILALTVYVRVNEIR